MIDYRYKRCVDFEKMIYVDIDLKALNVFKDKCKRNKNKLREYYNKVKNNVTDKDKWELQNCMAHALYFLDEAIREYINNNANNIWHWDLDEIEQYTKNLDMCEKMKHIAIEKNYKYNLDLDNLERFEIVNDNGYFYIVDRFEELKNVVSSDSKNQMGFYENKESGLISAKNKIGFY